MDGVFSSADGDVAGRATGRAELDKSLFRRLLLLMLLWSSSLFGVADGQKGVAGWRPRRRKEDVLLVVEGSGQVVGAVVLVLARWRIGGRRYRWFVEA